MSSYAIAQKICSATYAIFTQHATAILLPLTFPPQPSSFPPPHFTPHVSLSIGTVQLVVYRRKPRPLGRILVAIFQAVCGSPTWRKWRYSMREVDRELADARLVNYTIPRGCRSPKFVSYGVWSWASHTSGVSSGGERRRCYADMWRYEKW